jgi:hypothetical protein
VSLPVLFQALVRSAATGTHDALESIEMEDDGLERRRSLLRLLVWAQATLQKALVAVRWCRLRAAQFKSVFAIFLKLLWRLKEIRQRRRRRPWRRMIKRGRRRRRKSPSIEPLWLIQYGIYIQLCILSHRVVTTSFLTIVEVKRNLFFLLNLTVFVTGGVAAPVLEKTAVECRRRLQYQIFLSLLATRSPSHVRIVRSDNGHVTLNSHAGYCIALSLRMAPKSAQVGISVDFVVVDVGRNRRNRKAIEFIGVSCR